MKNLVQLVALLLVIALGSYCLVLRGKVTRLANENVFLKNKSTFYLLNSYFAEAEGPAESQDKRAVHELLLEPLLTEVRNSGWEVQQNGNRVNLRYKGTEIGHIDEQTNLVWESSKLGLLWGDGKAIAGSNVEVFH